MSTILGKIQNAGSAVVGGFKAVGNGAKALGQAVISPNAAKVGEAAIRNGIDTLYSNVSKGFKNAVEVMERETSTAGQVMGGIEALRAPIAKMSEKTFTPVDISIDDTITKQSGTKLFNTLGSYHVKVINKGEEISRVVGDKVHAVVRFALTPIRLLFKLFQIENVGAVIQNAVSLAVGFIARAALLVISQAFHVLPYIAIAAVIALIASPTIVATIFGGPIAGAAVGYATVQTIVSLILNKKVNILNAKTAANRQQIAQLQNQAAQSAQTTKRAKIALGAVALTAALTAAYYYGPSAVQAAAPYAASAYNATKAFGSAVYASLPSFGSSVNTTVANNTNVTVPMFSSPIDPTNTCAVGSRPADGISLLSDKPYVDRIRSFVGL